MFTPAETARPFPKAAPRKKKGWAKEKEKCFSNRYPQEKRYRGGDGTETEDSKASFEQ